LQSADPDLNNVIIPDTQDELLTQRPIKSAPIKSDLMMLAMDPSSPFATASSAGSMEYIVRTPIDNSNDETKQVSESLEGKLKHQSLNTFMINSSTSTSQIQNSNSG